MSDNPDQPTAAVREPSTQAVRIWTAHWQTQHIAAQEWIHFLEAQLDKWASAPSEAWEKKGHEVEKELLDRNIKLAAAQEQITNLKASRDADQQITGLATILWADRVRELEKALLEQRSGIPPHAVCLFKDGKQWCAVYGDFKDLHESPAYFSPTGTIAIQGLLQTHPRRIRWDTDVKDMVEEQFNTTWLKQEEAAAKASSTSTPKPDPKLKAMLKNALENKGLKWSPEEQAELWRCLAGCEKLETQAASQVASNREVEQLRKDIRKLECRLQVKSNELVYAKEVEAKVAGHLDQIDTALTCEEIRTGKIRDLVQNALAALGRKKV